MKDSILLATAVAIFVTAAVFFYRSDERHSTVGSSASSSKKLQASLHKPGVRNNENRNSHSDPARARDGEDERVAEHSAETPQLPSLFEGARRKGVGRDSGRKEQPKLSKVVHGVPTEEWARERSNALGYAPITLSQDPGVRVYVQCMELKKGGPSYVGTGACEALVAKERGGAERLLSRSRPN